MLVLQTLWLLLPAAVANMIPILAKPMFPEWNTPVDFGWRWKGKELFGSHKTYRGFVSGMIAGLIIFNFQQIAYRATPLIREISLFNYSEVPAIAGAWIGFGALLGDLIKSFFKRRIAIAPGQAWIPFDQIDWIIGTLLSLSVFYVPSLPIILLSFLFGVGLHFLFKYVGYVWKINPTPL